MIPKIIPPLVLALAMTAMIFCTGAYGAAASDSGAVKLEKKISKNSRVCKKVKLTGSHIGQRVCLKKKEWDAMAKAAQESLRNSTTVSRGGVSQGG